MSGERRQLFERPLPEGYREELREQIAQRPEDPPARTGSTLIFELGGVKLGLQTSIAWAVAPTLHIARIPHRTGTVLMGLVAFRGDILPCCSLARLLDIENERASMRTLILEEAPGRRWAIPVDRMLGVRITGTHPAQEKAPFGTQWLQGSYHDDLGDFHLLNHEVLFRQMTLATA